MKKAFKTIIAIAAAALAFTACEQTIDEPIQEENISGKHTVSFVVSDNATKTTVAENSGVAEFSWGNEDKVPANFHLYENGVAGETTDVTLTSGLMSITATFTGNTAPYSYTGFYSFYTQDGATYPYVDAAQTMRSGKYDYKSDILVAKKTEGSDTQTSPLLLQFKRVVAINKMTLKGMTLADDEYFTEVIITSDKAIAGKYSWSSTDADCAWMANGKTITVKGCNQSENKDVIYFVSAPVTDATLTISATTNKGNSYFKAFTKTISFTEGSYNSFGVTMAAEKVMTFTYASHLGWTVNADDKTSYYLLNSGKTITTPVFSFDQINKIEITQRTFGGTNYNTTDVKLNDSVIASVVADGSSLKNSSTSAPLYTTATSDAQLVFEANPNCCSDANGTGISVIKIHYLGSDPILSGAYSITIDDAIENGTVEANMNEAAEGSLVTLTITPDAGYELDELTVTNTTTSEDITVTDNAFEMPASDVFVTATFVTNHIYGTFDFSKEGGFADWGSSYTEHIFEATEAKVTFSDANKQSNTITDVPVTRGRDIVFELLESDKQISSISLQTKKWAAKEQTISVHTSIDGVNYQTLSTTGNETDGVSVDITSNAVKYVKFTFSSSSNQIGISKLVFTTESKLDASTIHVTGVSLDKTTATLLPGLTIDLIPTVSPDDASDKSVSWSSSNESAATVDANGTVTAVAVGSATITVTTTDGGQTATCDITVVDTEHAGTEADPYSVADALLVIDCAGSTSSAVYVTGEIKSITEVSTQYGNATYLIKDNGSDNELTVFRGKYLNNSSFTSEDQIAVGEVVTIYGKLTVYDETKEIAQGNYITSTNAPYLSASASKTNVVAAGESITITVDTNIDGWTVSSTDDTNFSVVKTNATTATVTVTENTGAARSATITISATGAEDVEITLNQAAASGLATTYTLVTDASTLKSGDVIVIASAANGKAAGAMGTNAFLTSVDATVSNGTLTSADAIEITLGGSADAWTLTSSKEGTYGATAAKKLSHTGGTTTWTISIATDGTATIASTNEDYGRILYNVNSPRFLNYTSTTSVSMLLPEIYKKN